MEVVPLPPLRPREASVGWSDDVENTPEPTSSTDASRLGSSTALESSSSTQGTEVKRGLRMSAFGRRPRVLAKTRLELIEYLVPLEDLESASVDGVMKFEPAALLVSVDCQQGAYTKVRWVEAVYAAQGSRVTSETPLLPGDTWIDYYRYPLIITEAEPHGVQPSEEGLRLIHGIVLWLAKNTEALWASDGVGAFPVHALLVRNTEESLDLVQAVFEADASYLTQVHDERGPFVGESALHITIINRREELAIKLMTLMHEQLGVEEAQAVLASQCTGAFFDEPPMCNLGSHALAWSAGLGQASVHAHAVSLGWRDWATCACKRTGFWPVHVATFRGDTSMLESLVGEFGLGQLDAEVHGFTPLLLAARIGKVDIVRKCLSYDRELLWRLGFVTQYQICIRPAVDSHVSEERMTLLEVLTKPDASVKTQEMLLDSFMTGLLFRIFQLKWRLQVRRWFWISTAVLIVYVLVLTALASPTLHNEHATRPLSVCTLVLALALAEEALCEIFMWIIRDRAEENKARKAHFVGSPSLAKLLFLLFAQRERLLRYVSLICSMVACAMQLASVPPESEGVRILLALASLTSWLLLMRQLFVLSEQLGVFNVMVDRMMTHDVAKFMVVFTPILLAFATAMDALHPGQRWASWWTSIEGLFMVAFVGDALNMSPDSGTYWDPSALGEQFGAAVVFYLLYLGFLMVSAILMVNLLIAMMSTTYESTQLDATREWRLMFARTVLRMELLSPSCLVRQKTIGEVHVGGRHFIQYRVHDEEKETMDPFNYIERHDAPQATNRYALMVTMHEKLMALQAAVSSIDRRLDALPLSATVAF